MREVGDLLVEPISSQDPESLTRKKKAIVRKSDRVDAMMKREKRGRWSCFERMLVNAERAMKGMRSLNRRSKAWSMNEER